MPSLGLDCHVVEAGRGTPSMDDQVVLVVAPGRVVLLPSIDECLEAPPPVRLSGKRSREPEEGMLDVPFEEALFSAYKGSARAAKRADCPAIDEPSSAVPFPREGPFREPTRPFSEALLPFVGVWSIKAERDSSEASIFHSAVFSPAYFRSETQ